MVVLCSQLSGLNWSPSGDFTASRLLCVCTGARCSCRHGVRMSITQLQPLGASVSPGLRLGFFVLFAAKSWLFILSVVFHHELMWSLLWFLLCCMVCRTHCAQCMLQDCCRTAAISESLFSFSLSPSFIAEINKSRPNLWEVCTSCCSCFPYVDTYLFMVGKNNRNPVTWPPQTPSVGAISSGWAIASL